MADEKQQRPAPGDDAPAGTTGTGENICPDCRGTGRKGERACPTCDGTGKVIEGVGGG
jgi:DnaJ-class molecular chaperone